MLGALELTTAPGGKPGPETAVTPWGLRTLAAELGQGPIPGEFCRAAEAVVRCGGVELLDATGLVKALLDVRPLSIGGRLGSSMS